MQRQELRRRPSGAGGAAGLRVLAAPAAPGPMVGGVHNRHAHPQAHGLHSSPAATTLAAHWRCAAHCRRLAATLPPGVSGPRTPALQPIAHGLLDIETKHGGAHASGWLFYSLSLPLTWPTEPAQQSHVLHGCPCHWPCVYSTCRCTSLERMHVASLTGTLTVVGPLLHRRQPMCHDGRCAPNGRLNLEG